MSVEDSAAGQRFEDFGQTITDTFVPMSFSMDNVGSLLGQVRSVSLGTVQLSEVAVNHDMTFWRTHKLIRRSAQEYLKVCVQLRGNCVISQDGREAKLAPGDFMVYDTTRPYEFSVGGPFQMYAFMIPHTMLPLPASRLAQVTARPFSSQRGLGTFVSPFLVELGKRCVAGHHPSDMHLADALLDVLAASFAEQLSCEGAVGPDVGKRTLLLRVRAFIEHRLDDPGLDVATIAAAHHISVRYLQKRFREEGYTVTGWIRARRIEHCRKDLANVALAAVPVGSIGARWGLPNAAYLSRLFKETYGVSPTEYREMALG
jgi:AraC-like DNA-binding protein